MVPLHLADRFVEVADEGPYAGERTRFADLRQHDHRAVPRHPGVVPGDPGRPPPVVGDLGAGDEPVPVVGEFTDRRPVVGRRPVERHGGDDAPYIGGRGPGELLQHAPDLARRPVFRAHLRVHPAQPAADVPDGGERPRLVGPVGGVGVQPLVGEVDEDHEEFAALAHGARPGLPAVLDHPAAGVPRGGQHRGDGAVGAAAHQGAPAVLGGARLGPPHLVPDGAEVVGAAVVRGGECRVDRRRPGSVRSCWHGVHVGPPGGADRSQSVRRCAGSGRAHGRRSGGRRRGRARRRRGRAAGSRSRPAASAA